MFPNIEQAKFLNAFPKNPTQTAYRRFQRTPGIPVSEFDKSMERFRKSLEIKNPFEEYARKFGGV